ncbi:hypothetical protein V6M85_02990 [Sulfolobus tengchongensis]|uniref:Thermopsin n=1 Tax=Sulfolobus tengchongensis TaxID=207809 RepID=A0AAX4L2E8_9CREN
MATLGKSLSILFLTVYLLSMISPSLTQSAYQSSGVATSSNNQKVDPTIITFNQRLALTSIYQGYTDVNGPRSIALFPSYLTGIRAEEYWKSNCTRPVLELVGNGTQTWYHSTGMVLFNAHYGGNGLSLIAYGTYTSGSIADGFLFSLFMTPNSLIDNNQSISYWVSEPNLRGSPPEIFNSSPVQGAIPPLLDVQGVPMFPYSPNPYIVVQWDDYGNYMILYYVKYNGTPYNISVIPITTQIIGSISSTSPFDIYKLNVSYYPAENILLYSVINMNETNFTYPVLNSTVNGVIYGVFNLSNLNLSFPAGTYGFGIEGTSGASQGNLGLIFPGNTSFISTEKYYNLTFIEHGLPTGSRWAVDVNGTFINSTTNEISFLLPAGVYSYAISLISSSVFPAQFEVSPSSGTIYLNKNTTVIVYFNEIVSKEMLNLTFIESGLPTGLPWSVVVNGTMRTTDTNEISFLLPEGIYQYSVISPANYSSSPSVGEIKLITNTTIFITFSSTLHAVTFVEEGLPQGTMWNVTINGHNFSTSNNEIKIYLSSGKYNYSINDVIINAQSLVSFSNLAPSLYYIPSPQQGTFYFNGSTNKVIYIQFFNGMNVNFQIVVQGKYGQQYIGSLACIYGTNPVEIEVNAYYYDITSGSTIPLNSVVVKLSSYSKEGNLIYDTVLTNSQGIAYDNLSSISPTYPIIVPVLVSLGLLTKEITVVFESYENQVKTFSLCVYNDSQFYNLIFFVNGSSLLLLHDNASSYLGGFVGIKAIPQGAGLRYPIYYVLIYPKGSTIPVNLLSTSYTITNPYVILLANAIIWEAEYGNLGYLTAMWGPNSYMYNCILNNYNNNWKQKIFIYLSYADYIALVIGPLLETITNVANLAEDIICLINGLMKGEIGLTAKYGSETAHVIISILKDKYNVIEGPNYDVLCFLQNFNKLTPSQQNQLLSQLISVAYNIENPNENVISLGIKILEKMGENFATAAITSSAAGILAAFAAMRFAQTLFIDATTAAYFVRFTFFSVLEDTFLSATSAVIRVVLLLIIGTILDEEFLIPTANLMIISNKIEDLMVNYIYPIEFYTLSNMQLNGYVANLTDGMLLYRDTMLLEALWSVWYFTNSMLDNESILNPQSIAQGRLFFNDGKVCLNSFYQLNSSYGSLLSNAVDILNQNDPPSINMSGLLGNKEIIGGETLFYTFPTRNIVGIATIGNNTYTEIFYGKTYIIVNETGIYGNYPYAVFNKIGNLTDIVLFNASEGNLVIYSNANVNLTPYSFINESINPFQSEEVENNSLIMLNLMNRDNNSLINEGNSTLAFVLNKPSLLEINGTIIHLPYNKITILVPAGKYQYEIISNNNTLQKGSLSLGNSSHVVVTSSLGRIPLFPWILIAFVIVLIIVVLIVILNRKI